MASAEMPRRDKHCFLKICVKNEKLNLNFDILCIFMQFYLTSGVVRI